MKTSDIEALVAPLHADATSGATELTAAAATLIERAATEAREPAGAATASSLTSLVFALLDAQPAMAPLVALAREVLGHVQGGAASAEMLSSVALAARAFRESLRTKAAQAARVAAASLPDGLILTLSLSSTVKDALLAAARRPIQVVCLESRPLAEGRTLARVLARAGASVTLAVDAAADSLLPECAAVLLGADSVGDRGAVNKIGSAAVARGAAHYGVPLLVAADSSKFLPVGFPQLLAGDRPAEEVGLVPGVRVWNRYFEAFPASLVTSFSSEEGPLRVDELERRRTELALPPALAAWAAARPS